MRWLIQQLEKSSNGAFRFSPGFKYVYLGRPEFDANVLMTDAADQLITLRSDSGVVTLVFHVHAWSGSIFLTVNGDTRTIDLYAATHGYRSIDIETNGQTDIEIRTGAQRHEDSQGNEVWLAAVEFSVPQQWRSQSMPVSPWCTLTHGQNGTFLTLTNDTVIGSSIVNTGVWASRDVELFESLIEPGMTVIDIGANIGHHTVVYSKLVGPRGRVISIEPQTIIFRMLAANAVINGCSNVELINCCVGESSGYVNLFPIDYSSRTNFGALGVAPGSDEGAAGSGEKVRIDTLDTLLSELIHPLEACDFIKIDVQTFELFVLRGALQTLNAFRPTLFLEISPFWMRKYYDYKEIYKLLFSIDYEIIHISDPSIRPGAIKGWSGQDNEEWDILARPKERLA